MADATSITNMFSLPIAPQGTAIPGDITANVQQAGFLASNLFNTYSGLLTQQGVYASKILDFSQLENDPNFQRGNPINVQALTTLTSKLSLATQSSTMSSAMMSMSKTQEVILPQLRSSLLNVCSVVDSNMNTTKSVGNGSFFSMTSKSLFTDFTNFFKNNSVALITLLTMGATIAAMLKTSSSSPVENTQLDQILDLSVSQITPAVSLDSINDTVSETITDPDQAATVSASIKTSIANTVNKTIGTVITNTSDYQEITINLQDPLGVDIRDALLNDITTVVNTSISSAVSSTPGLTEDEILEITTNLNADISEGLAPETLGNMGLPSLRSVIDGVVAESRNGTLNALNEAVATFSENVVSDIGLSTEPIEDGSVEAVDYLQNVKKFLDRRLAMNTTGARVGDITAVETYLKTVLKTQDMSLLNLKNMQTYLNELLSEN